MRDELDRRGVNVKGLVVERDRSTGLTVVLVRPDDRAILTHEGTIGDLRAGSIDPEFLAAASHVHVASYFLQGRLAPDLPALFERVRANGATTSLDPNWDPSERWNGGVRGLLSHTDVFLPNATEAVHIARATSLEEAVITLAAEVGVVVVKTGSDGAVAARGDELVRAPAPAVDAVDTTGAGDSFDAGFLVSWLAADPLERALAIANACGGLSTRALGGVDAQPTIEEALAHAELTSD